MRPWGLIVAVLAVVLSIGAHNWAVLEASPEEDDGWARLGIWNYESVAPQVPAGKWADSTAPGNESIARAGQLITVSTVAYASWAVIELAVMLGVSSRKTIAVRAIFGTIGLATAIAGRTAAANGIRAAIASWESPTLQFEVRQSPVGYTYDMIGFFVVAAFGLWRFVLLLRAWYNLTED